MVEVTYTMMSYDEKSNEGFIADLA